MVSYEDLQYLLAFSQANTLSQVAEQFHISQPTITRAMKRIEDTFDVPLFVRTKNSITLNDTGRLAAEEAAVALKQAASMLQRVRTYHQAKHTIAIGSSAAVQIPDLILRLSAAHPEMTISTELKKPAELLAGLESDRYQLIILPHLPDGPGLVSTTIGEEHLLFSLPPKHRFAQRTSLTLAEMNGENMLLFSEIGFWHDLVMEKMPASRFLVQNDRYSFEELIANSVLPCFATDLASRGLPPAGARILVPITDPEVNVTYYLVCKQENQRKFHTLFRE